MKYALRGIIVLFCLIPIICHAQAQPAVTDKLVNFPTTFFSKVNNQTAKLDAALTRQTRRYLHRLAKQEDKIRRYADSAAARRLSGSLGPDYNALAQSWPGATGQPGSKGPGTGGSYLPYLDSLKTSLKFLQQNPALLPGGVSNQGQIASSLAQVSQLESKMQSAGQVQQLIRQRKEQIRQTLSQYAHLPSGLQAGYQGYSREAYYYGAQVKAYKDELSDPDKLTLRALGLLGQLPSFRQFMVTHSELAELFSLPGSGAPGGAKALAGLQTRAGVQQAIQTQVTAGGPDAAGAVSQKVQAAQTALNNLKTRVSQAGGGNSGMDIPDFRPNAQHTRTFLKRLQFGLDIGSMPSGYSFPTTSTISASLGYKLNDNNSIGVRAAYLLGWGKDIGHIAIGSQGLSFGSFLTMKVKGSFYGIIEFDEIYQQPFNSLSQLHDPVLWQQSALAGVSKRYKIGRKLTGNVQLLYDFLAVQEMPARSPLVFRVGYNF